MVLKWYWYPFILRFRIRHRLLNVPNGSLGEFGSTSRCTVNVYYH